MVKDIYKVVKNDDGSIQCGHLCTGVSNIRLFRGKNRYGFNDVGTKKFIECVLGDKFYSIKRSAESKATSAASYNKLFYQIVTEELGCSPSILMKVWDSTVYANSVLPYKHLINKYAKFNGAKFSPYDIRDIIRNKELIEQAEKDGNSNIVPFIIRFGCSPKKIKELFGKGLWKQLCKNSLTHNKYLSGVVDIDNKPFIKEILLLPKTIWKSKYFNSYFKQSIMHYPNLTIPFIINTLNKGSKVKDYFDCDFCKNLDRDLHKFFDTWSLAEQLDKKKPNPNWTPEKIHKMHEQYTKEINERKYSKDIIKHLEDVTVQEMFLKDETDTFRAELLKSAYRVSEEGRMMHHCVGSYVDQVKNGSYLVYHITKNGEPHSTLGINVRFSGEEVGYRFSQHYGKCNSFITEESAKKLSRSVVESLNKQLSQKVLDNIKNLMK